MPVEGVSGMAIAATGAGALLVWSGIKGYSVTTSLKSLLSGQVPAHVVAHPITAPVTGIPGTMSISGQQLVGGTNNPIAADALRYQGAGYVWGGAPAKGIGNWDCSSFVNWVVSHDLGMAIPGYGPGAYKGDVHGPTTLQWRFFGTSVPRSQVQAGDIVVWLSHMGVAISNSQMISARSASSNPPTGIDTIDGDIPGEPVTFRRL